MPRWAAVTIGLGVLVVAASFVPGILDGTWLGKTRSGKLVALSGASARWMGAGTLSLVLVILAPMFPTRRSAMTWLALAFGVAATCTAMSFLTR